MAASLEFIQGDITQIAADAIVNAANSSLAGGGGVDGAIHRAGGPSIMEECRKIGGCPTGSAVATTAGELEGRDGFHAGGAVEYGRGEEERAFEGGYQSWLYPGQQYELGALAFPSISTGVYGYPLELAAPIALYTVIEHVKKPTSVKQVTFVLFGDRAYQAFEQALGKFS